MYTILSDAIGVMTEIVIANLGVDLIIWLLGWIFIITVVAIGIDTDMQLLIPVGLLQMLSHMMPQFSLVFPWLPYLELSLRLMSVLSCHEF